MLLGEDSKNEISFSFRMYFFTLKICILISKTMLKLPIIAHLHALSFCVVQLKVPPAVEELPPFEG